MINTLHDMYSSTLIAELEDGRLLNDRVNCIGSYCPKTGYVF